MRTCLRCQTEMVEDCDIKVEGAGYGIVLSNGTNVFAKRMGKPNVAVCPKCGEISFYLADCEKIK